jgi:hypothetical protein
MLNLVLDWLFLELTPHRVSPLYTQVEARRLIESRPAHTTWPARFLTSHALQGKSPYGGSHAQILGFLQACPYQPPSSHLPLGPLGPSSYKTANGVTRPLLGGSHLGAISPTKVIG